MPLSMGRVISNMGGAINSFCLYRTRPGGNMQRFLATLHRVGIHVYVAATTRQGLARNTLGEYNLFKFFSGVFAYKRIKRSGGSPCVCYRTLSFLNAGGSRALIFRSTCRTTGATGKTNFCITTICSDHRGTPRGVGTMSSVCLGGFLFPDGFVGSVGGVGWRGDNGPKTPPFITLWGWYWTCGGQERV